MTLSWLNFKSCTRKSYLAVRAVRAVTSEARGQGQGRQRHLLIYYVAYVSPHERPILIHAVMEHTRKGLPG